MSKIPKEQWDAVRAMVADGSIYSRAFLELSPALKTFAINCADNPKGHFGERILASQCGVETAKKILTDYVSRNIRFITSVPNNLQTREMVEHVLSCSYRIDPSIPNIAKINQELLDSSLLLIAIKTDPSAIGHVNYMPIDEDISNVYVSKLLSMWKTSGATSGVKSLVLEGIENGWINEINVGPFVENVPSFFQQIPDHMKTESVCRSSCRRLENIEEIKQFVSELTYQQIVLSGLERMGIATSPESLVAAASRASRAQQIKLLKYGLVAHGPDVVIPIAKTDKQKLFMCNLFGFDEVSKYHQLSKRVRRDALGDALDI